jgi:hypothetical protein
MKTAITTLIDRASSFLDLQPVLALFFAGALLAVFLTTFLPRRNNPESPAADGLLWTLYRRGTRLAWALAMVLSLVSTFSVVRVYLHQTLSRFQRTHGRVTDANFAAIQTIWGTSQEQGELLFTPYFEEEITERIESEDVTKPAVLRKKTVRTTVTANPFVSARHEVSLRQNARKKGSAATTLRANSPGNSETRATGS